MEKYILVQLHEVPQKVGNNSLLCTLSEIGAQKDKRLLQQL